MLLPPGSDYSGFSQPQRKAGFLCVVIQELRGKIGTSLVYKIKWALGEYDPGSSWK